MRIFVVAAGLTLAACSSPHSSSPAGTDINAVAAEAQGDIDTYAANTLQPTTMAPGPAETPLQRPLAQPDTVAEAPFAPDSAQGAAQVVQTFFALIEGGNYGEAWRLWGDGGRASGMTRRAFADSFAKYAAYHAEVGAPGDIDAGAGQRYVSVPVRAYGTLKAGKQPFVLRGTVTLHRTAVDGATAEQRSWRISDTSLKPKPQAAAVTGALVRYRCAGETRISVRFAEDPDTATIRRGNRDVAVLAGQRPASGIWYKGKGYELRGKGEDANYTVPGQPAVGCTVSD